jgi:ribosomal protein L34
MANGYKDELRERRKKQGAAKRMKGIAGRRVVRQQGAAQAPQPKPVGQIPRPQAKMSDAAPAAPAQVPQTTQQRVEAAKGRRTGLLGALEGDRDFAIAREAEARRVGVDVVAKERMLQDKITSEIGQTDAQAADILSQSRLRDAQTGQGVEFGFTDQAGIGMHINRLTSLRQQMVDTGASPDDLDEIDSQISVLMGTQEKMSEEGIWKNKLFSELYDENDPDSLDRALLATGHPIVNLGQREKEKLLQKAFAGGDPKKIATMLQALAGEKPSSPNKIKAEFFSNQLVGLREDRESHAITMGNLRAQKANPPAEIAKDKDKLATYNLQINAQIEAAAEAYRVSGVEEKVIQYQQQAEDFMLQYADDLGGAGTGNETVDATDPETVEGDEKNKSVGEFLKQRMKGGGTLREQIDKHRKEGVGEMPPPPEGFASWGDFMNDATDDDWERIAPEGWTTPEFKAFVAGQPKHSRGRR